MSPLHTQWDRDKEIKKWHYFSSILQFSFAARFHLLTFICVIIHLDSLIHL